MGKLHWVTWLTLLVFGGLGIANLCVPVQVYSSVPTIVEGGCIAHQTIHFVYESGWPWPYCASAAEEYEFPAPMNDWFRRQTLLLDLFVLAAFLGLMAWGVEGRCRRQIAWYQVRLTDLLVFGAVFSAVGGYLTWHRDQYRKSIRMLSDSHYEVSSSTYGANLEWEYCGPPILSTVLSRSRAPQGFTTWFHRSEAAAPTPEKLGSLKTYAPLKHLILSGSYSLAELSQLRTLQSIESVSTKHVNLFSLEVKALQFRQPKASEKDIMLAELSQLSNLRSLNFQQNFFRLNSIELRHLTRLNKLEYLDASSVLASEDRQAFKELTKIRSLRGLNVRENAIQDADLQTIGNLDRLEFLDLYQTAVGDAGLTYIAQLPRLRKLYLSGKPIGHDGLEVLATIASLRCVSLGEVDQPAVDAFRKRRPDVLLRQDNAPEVINP